MRRLDEAALTGVFMSAEQRTLATLLAKEEIRELAMLYSRGVDRKDIELLRTLYTKDATDLHGRFFSGSAADYLNFLEKSFPHMPMSGHFICNHLVSVDGDRGEGEVYALAYHVVPDRKGGFLEDFKAVRYVDRYRKETDRWLFASRVVEFDHESSRPMAAPPEPMRAAMTDATYTTLTSRLFARGSRA
jgi:ketosteroid isomerase-like protein